MAFLRLELCSVLLVLLLECSCGYFITIDAHAEECFHDQVTSGTKMGLIFEVAEGGFLDIDVTVSSVIQSSECSKTLLDAWGFDCPQTELKRADLISLCG